MQENNKQLTTPSIPIYNLFDFFYLKFDHSFYYFFLLFVGEGGERRNIGAKEEAITGKVRGGGEGEGGG